MNSTEARDGARTGGRPGQESNGDAAGRYYQVVFIWLKDQATFRRYLGLAAPVVGR